MTLVRNLKRGKMNSETQSIEKQTMRELTAEETDLVGGAVMANIGAGIGGASIAMGGYALYGGANGSLDFGGFAGAATAGFIAGAAFGHPSAIAAGAVAGGVVDSWLDS